MNDQQLPNRIDQMTQQNYIDRAYQEKRDEIESLLTGFSLKGRHLPALRKRLSRHYHESEGRRDWSHVADLDKIAEALRSGTKNYQETT